MGRAAGLRSTRVAALEEQKRELAVRLEARRDPSGEVRRAGLHVGAMREGGRGKGEGGGLSLNRGGSKPSLNNPLQRLPSHGSYFGFVGPEYQETGDVSSAV